MNFRAFISLTLLFALFFLPNNLYSFTNNVLLQAKLINENDNNPIGAEVTFEDSEGDKIRVNADPLTGIFEQLLKADHEYKITFQGPEIIRKVITFKTKESETYSEQKEEFAVIKLEPKAKILNLNISEDENNISENEKKSLNELKSLLRFNRSLYIDIVCSTNELKTKFETIIEDKSWRIYRGKITVYDSNNYSKLPVKFDGGNDTVVIVNKVEDPFK